MSKKLLPSNDRVIVKPVEEGEQMYGSIVIPDMGKERPEMGEVISVGPGRQTDFGQLFMGYYLARKIVDGECVTMLCPEDSNSDNYCKALRDCN